MRVHDIGETLAAHPILRQFDAGTLELLAGCARNEHFRPGEKIFAEGDAADKTYLLREGDVAVEIASPERPPIIVETLHAGDLLGWSWMVSPYRHMSDARAVTDVRAVSLDATCLRAKCDLNPVLGYRMFQHWTPHMAARMRSMRMQLLDVYGTRKG